MLAESMNKQSFIFWIGEQSNLKAQKSLRTFSWFYQHLETEGADNNCAGTALKGRAGTSAVCVCVCVYGEVVPGREISVQCKEVLFLPRQSWGA